MRRIRIWCAAASTGQEPYTLAICLKELGKELNGSRHQHSATDLSTEVLEKAKSGIFSQFEVQRGLPVLMLVKYFSQVGEMWQIAPEIRAMVKFQPLNLLNDFSSIGAFDVVFCRNVLIYFDQETKIDVLNRIDAVIERGWIPRAGRRRELLLRPDASLQADCRSPRPLRARVRSWPRRTRATW